MILHEAKLRTQHLCWIAGILSNFGIYMLLPVPFLWLINI